MAVLRWSNPESGGAKVLSPADLEIAALQVSSPGGLQSMLVLASPTRRRSAGCSMEAGAAKHAVPHALRLVQELPMKPSAEDAARCAVHCLRTWRLPALPAVA